MKNGGIYLVCLQSSAASPQGGDRIWCSEAGGDGLRSSRRAIFRGIQLAKSNWCFNVRAFVLVKISGEINRDAGSIFSNRFA
jgi:hypothetical protein